VQKIDSRSGTAIGPVMLPRRRPIELTALMGGAGPYPLIWVTARGVSYSWVASCGNVWMTRLQ